MITAVGNGLPRDVVQQVLDNDSACWSNIGCIADTCAASRVLARLVVHTVLANRDATLLIELKKNVPHLSMLYCCGKCPGETKHFVPIFRKFSLNF